MADLGAGTVDGLIVWHPDRLHRSPLELEEFITLVENTGAQVQSVTAGERDLATPTGRFTPVSRVRSPAMRASTSPSGSDASTSSWPRMAR